MEGKGKPSKSKYGSVTLDKPKSFGIPKSTAAITDSKTTMEKNLGKKT